MLPDTKQKQSITQAGYVFGTSLLRPKQSVKWEGMKRSMTVKERSKTPKLQIECRRPLDTDYTGY